MVRLEDWHQADTQSLKEAIRQEWLDAAPAWRKWRSQFAIQSRAATDLIVEAALVKGGMRVLDLASGNGEPAISLARAIGPEGHVIATDLVRQMLLGARECAAQLGLLNITFQVTDAEALPFPTSTFDRVTCRFGVMFFPDLKKALREIRRVLKPGGRAAFSAWGDPERNTFHTATTDVLMRFAKPGPAKPNAPDQFKFAKPDSLSTALKQAGFLKVAETFHSIPWTWPGTPEEYWNSSLELRVSFRKVFNTLLPDQQARAKQESLVEIERYYDGRQVNFEAYIVVAVSFPA